MATKLASLLISSLESQTGRSLFSSNLELRDSWGIDCYTRTLIRAVLAQVGMKEEAIDQFMLQSLYPSFHLVPPDRAHDMR